MLFAWPDETAERNDYEVAIPKLGSLILTHDWDGEVAGLKSVPPQERPPVPVVFFAFRAMVGIGLVLLAIVLVGALLRWRGRLYDTRWFSFICAFSSPLPFLAILAGWTVTETGRQPYVVYGLLRTADAVSPVAAGAVFGSLALFVVVYTVLLIAFFFYATRLVLRGPEVGDAGARSRFGAAGRRERRARAGRNSAEWIGTCRFLLGLAVAFGVAMYVVMDGFDLGIGILFPFAPDEPERSTMINSIAPVWDGNETWLVMGGTLLLAAFPLAYATLLPAFYVPLLTMLFALIFRGVAFEFRFRAERSSAGLGLGLRRRFAARGVLPGGRARRVYQRHPGRGRRVQRRHVRFSELVRGGLRFRAGRRIRAARRDWLIVKTDGLSAKFGARRRPRRAAGNIGVHRAGQHLDPARLPAYRASAGSTWPNIAFLSPVPILTALIAFGIWRHIERRPERRPFVLSIALFLLAFLGLGISLWPYAVPYQATVWQAAASPPTLVFVGIGTAIILPIVLGYGGSRSGVPRQSRARYRLRALSRRRLGQRVEGPRQEGEVGGGREAVVAVLDQRDGDIAAREPLGETAG